MLSRTIRPAMALPHGNSTTPAGAPRIGLVPMEPIGSLQPSKTFDNGSDGGFRGNPIRSRVARAPGAADSLAARAPDPGGDSRPRGQAPGQPGAGPGPGREPGHRLPRLRRAAVGGAPPRPPRPGDPPGRPRRGGAGAGRP